MQVSQSCNYKRLRLSSRIYSKFLIKLTYPIFEKLSRHPTPTLSTVSARQTFNTFKSYKLHYSNYTMKTFDFLVLSVQSSLGKRKIFSKKKNLEAVEVKLEDILLCEEIPIVRRKSYTINAFVMDYHVYQKNWTSYIGDENDLAKAIIVKQL